MISAITNIFVGSPTNDQPKSLPPDVLQRLKELGCPAPESLNKLGQNLVHLRQIKYTAKLHGGAELVLVVAMIAAVIFGQYLLAVSLGISWVAVALDEVRKIKPIHQFKTAATNDIDSVNAWVTRMRTIIEQDDQDSLSPEHLAAIEQAINFATPELSAFLKITQSR